jgi:putative protease
MEYIMKLLAPANSIETAVSQINSGADEIYTGVLSDFGKNISFAARGNYCRNGKRMVLSAKELCQLDAICNEKKVGLDIAVNFVHPTGFLDDTGDEYSFLKTIDKLLNYNIHSFIIADIAAIKLAREKFPEIHITASSELEINNIHSARFFEEIGTSRIVLTYQITLEEIKHIVKNTKLEVEVFGHRGCSFHPGYCMFKHVVGETGVSGINIGTPCQNYYSLENTDEKKRYLDASLLCSICSVRNLVESGATVLKMVGRELEGISNAEVTKYYRNAIDNVMHGKTESVRDTLPGWWKKVLCSQQRCKYVDNDTTKSYTGSLGINISNANVPKRNSFENADIQNNVDEIRVLTLKDLPSAISKASHTVGVGLEYCSILIQNTGELDEAVSKINESGLKALLITPCIHVLEFDKVSDLIIEFIRKNPTADIVFNDWGMLSYISKNVIKSPESRWWLGRLLSRTMADWPWFDVITRDESDEVMQRLTCNSICHDKIYKIIKKYNIDGIEINNNKLNVENISKIKEQGLLVKIHLNKKLLAAGRSCIYMTNKLGQDFNNSCDGNCGKLNLNLTALDSTDLLYDNNPLLQKFYPDILLAGAGIFDNSNNNSLEVDSDKIDGICMTL